MPSQEEICEEIRTTVDFALTELTDQDGCLRLEKNFDGLSPNFIWHDLGDISPFLFQSGYAAEAWELIEQCETFLKRATPLVPGQKTLGLRNSFEKSYEFTDLFVGLEDAYRRLEPGTAFPILELAVDRVLKKFGIGKRHGSYYSNSIGLRFPIVDTRDALFVEIFADLFESTEESRFIEYSKGVGDLVREIRTRDPYGLLPNFVAKIPGVRQVPLRGYTLMKNQSNALYSILRLWEVTKESKLLEEFEVFFSNVLRCFRVPCGGMSDRFQKGKNDGICSLKASFASLDAITDYYLLTSDRRFLGNGYEIVESWNSRLSAIGLWPKSSGLSDSFFDSQTDMAVAMWRFGSISKNDLAMETADRAFQGLRHFHAKQGFPLSCNIESGLPSSTIVRTKFVFLYLKALFSCKVRIDDPKGLNQTEFRRLIRDR